MKTKVTNKYIKANYANIIAVPYCGLQTLLNEFYPLFYNCGVYGWNCDFYIIDDICICTGYRPFGKRVDYKIIEKYEELAINKTSEEKNELLKAFIKEVI